MYDKLKYNQLITRHTSIKGGNMGVKIKDIRTICTAPEGINLVTVKVETSQPGT